MWTGSLVLLPSLWGLVPPTQSPPHTHIHTQELNKHGAGPRAWIQAPALTKPSFSCHRHPYCKMGMRDLLTSQSYWEHSSRCCVVASPRCEWLQGTPSFTSCSLFQVTPLCQVTRTVGSAIPATRAHEMSGVRGMCVTGYFVRITCKKV